MLTLVETDLQTGTSQCWRVDAISQWWLRRIFKARNARESTWTHQTAEAIQRCRRLSCFRRFVQFLPGLHWRVYWCSCQAQSWPVKYCSQLVRWSTPREKGWGKWILLHQWHSALYLGTFESTSASSLHRHRYSPWWRCRGSFLYDGPCHDCILS